MRKQDLVEKIAEQAGLSRTDAAKALDAVTDTIVDAAKSGDEVNISGFGKFSVSERNARTGRNPQTGEEIQIKASKGLKFSAGTAVKSAING